MESLLKAHPRVCPECKESFLSKHLDTIYCSKSCKDKAWRHRNPRYNYEWFEKHPIAKLERNFYRQSPRERKKHRKYLKEKYASYKSYYDQYRKLNPEKTRARVLANQLIELGSECEICGSSDNLMRHHPDYSEPLVIVTVCSGCHMNVHRGK